MNKHEHKNKSDMVKKITLIFAGIVSVFNLNAQVTETVSVGAGYTNDVYYSLENDEVKTTDRANWDIAFQVSGMGSTIRTNGANDVVLYNYEKGDTSHWSSVDTAGISGWKKYYNSDSSWSKGAFSETAKGMFDLGWGKYSMITHYVTADSLFVLKLANGEYKKLWIDRLASGVYYFKHADLDGSNEKLDTLRKADFVDRNFGYYSLQNGTKTDREPDNNSWDLVFGKYAKEVGPAYVMGVTGVLANSGVNINKVSGVDVANADTLNTSFSNNIAEIGYDWKKLNYATYQYAAVDSLTYFVKSIVGDIWKVVFTGFGGSSTGNFMFTKEKVIALSLEEGQALSQLGIYPNPATDLVNIVFNQREASALQLNLYSLSGKLVHTKSLNDAKAGINQQNLNVSHLPKGMYVLSINSLHDKVQQTIIVK